MPAELLAAKKSMIDWDKQTIVGAGKKTKKRKETPIVFAEVANQFYLEDAKSAKVVTAFVIDFHLSHIGWHFDKNMRLKKTQKTL